MLGLLVLKFSLLSILGVRCRNVYAVSDALAQVQRLNDASGASSTSAYQHTKERNRSGDSDRLSTSNCIPRMYLNLEIPGETPGSLLLDVFSDEKLVSHLGRHNLDSLPATGPVTVLDLPSKLKAGARSYRKLYAYITDEFQVNSSIEDTQHRPFALSLTDNTHVIIWSSRAGTDGVYAQIFSKDWNKVGTEFQINQSANAYDRGYVTAAVLRSGSYIVVWSTSSYNVYARIFDKDVGQGSEFQANTVSSSGKWVHVSGLDNGGFVITWARYDVYARIYDSAGNPSGSDFIVPTYTTGDQYFARSTALPNGTFVIVWPGEGEEDDRGIYAQILQNDGTKVGSQFPVNTYTTDTQEYAYLDTLKDGRFVIAWQSQDQPDDGSGDGVFYQIFDSSGAKIGNETQSNQHVSGNQVVRDVVGLEDGGFLFTWTEESGQDGDDHGAYGRRYDQYGIASGDEFQINVFTTGVQARSISAATKCGFFTTWHSEDQDGNGYGIYARAYLDSISPLRLNYPIQNINAYKLQPFSFVVPVNTFHTTSTDPITYSTHILLDGKYQDIDLLWIAFDESSRTFSGTPTEELTYTIQVEAFDGCGYALSEFQLAISNNTKPVANALIPNQVVPFSRDEVWEYYVPKNTFKDFEGDTIVYTSAVMVTGDQETNLNTIWETLTFDASDGKLHGIPNLTGQFAIRIYADDGIGDPVPAPIDMNVEIVSQGIDVLELYEIAQRGFRGFISSDDSYFWIANEGNLKRFDLSSGNPYLITGPSVEYNFSQNITALVEITSDRFVIGDSEGNLRLLSSTAASEISSLSLSQEVSDLYNDVITVIYAIHAGSVSVIDFSSGSLVLHSTNSISVAATSLAKTADIIYAGTEQGLYEIGILTGAIEDLNISDLGYVYDLAIHGTYMYALKSYELWIFDISNTDAITVLNRKTLNGLGTSLTVAQIDKDLVIFISEGNNRLNIINVSNPLNLISEGYYESASTLHSAFVSSTGRWAIVLEESEVFTVEFFRRNIQLQVCDTSSDSCTDVLEIQAMTDLSKDVNVAEHLPTYKTDFTYGLSYTYALFEVSGSNYRSPPDWLSHSKVEDKVFRISGQPPEYLTGSVFDFEVQVYALESDGDTLLTIKKIISVSIVARHASVVSTIPDQSLEVGEEWLFSFSDSVFSNGDEIECEYQIDSQWVKSYDLPYILFTPSSRQWSITSIDSTKENLFSCDPCDATEYSKTYVIRVTARNSYSETDTGVSTTFNLFIYSGRIPDQEVHPGIYETIILSESIFPLGVDYTVYLLNENGESNGLPWWVLYISNERKILIFPSASEIDQDLDIEVFGSNNGVELRSQFKIQVRNSDPVALGELENQRIKLGDALNYSFSSDTFFDADGDALSYRTEWKQEDGTLTTIIPSWITFTENSRTFYGSPSSQGSYTLVVYASDGLGGETSIEFVIEAYNNSPIRNPESSLENTTVHIGNPFSLTLSSNIFTDADGHSLTYTAIQEDGSSLPSWLVFNSLTLSFSGTPAASDLENTSISIKITASDGYSSAETTFSLSITNSAPQVGSLQDQTVHIGNLFSLSLLPSLFTDADEDPLTYSATQQDGSSLPSWLAFNSVTLSFSGTPAASDLENTSISIKITASDGYSSAETTFALSITNSAPQVDSLQDQTVHIGNLFSLSLLPSLFTDADGDPLTYSATQQDGSSLPSWLTFTSVTLLFSGTPAASDLENTSISIKLSASDGYASAETTFALSVTNSAPQVGSLQDQTVHIGNLFSLSLSSSLFTDADGDQLTISATQQDGSSLPSWLTFTSVTLSFSGTPVASDLENTSISIKITASDGYSSAEKIFALSIANSAPQAGSLQDQTVHIGELFSLSLSSSLFTDADEDPLTYSATQQDGSSLPSWLSVNTLTLSLSGTPTTSDLQNTSISIKITASDGYASAEATFALSVTNSAPQVGSLQDQTVHIGNLFSLSLSSSLFTDADGDQLTISATQQDGSSLPSWLTFNTVTSLLSGTPTTSDLQNTSISIKITASDGYASAETTFALSVTNSAPQVGSLQDQTAHIGEFFSLSLSFSLFTDADGDLLTISATQQDGSSLPSWLIFNTVALSLSGTPLTSDLQNTSISIKIAASDGYASAETTFSLSIANSAPQVGSLQDQTVHIGELFSLSLSSSLFTDADGDPLTYSATQQDGSSLPSWLSVNTLTLSLSGTPTTSDLQNTSISIKITASDGYASAEATFALSVTNSAPQVGSLQDQTVHIGNLFSLSLSSSLFTDADGDQLTISATQQDGSSLPSWLTFNTVTSLLSGTPTTSDLQNTSINIKITASDGYASAEATFALSVTNSVPQVGSLQDQTVHIGEFFSLSLSFSLFTDADGDLLTYSATQQDGSSLPSWLTFNTVALSLSGTPLTSDLQNTSISIKIAASDGYASAETTFSLSVTNSVPQVGSLQDQTVHIGEFFSLSLSSSLFTDADGDQLTYLATQQDGSSLPSWLTFNSVTLSLSGTPVSSDLQNTSISIKLSASDTYTSAETTFSLSVANSAPQGGSIENKSIHIGNAFSLTLASDLFTDDDGDLLQYTANQVDGSPLPSWLSFNPNTHQFSGAPTAPELQNTVLNIKVSASDGYITAEASFEISITNQPPVLAYSIASQIASALQQGSIRLKPGVQFQYIISGSTFTDGDNDLLTFSSRLSNGDPLPQWLSFDPNTQQYYGTPLQSETLSISVTASDGYVSASDTFTLSIENKVPVLNSPLQFQFDSKYPDAFADGSLLSFQFSPDTFTDEDDSLTYSAVFSENGGDWRSLDSSWIELEGRTFSGTVSATSNSNSTISLQVTASDGQESLTDTFSFTLLSVFPSSSPSTIHINSQKDSIEAELSTNGPKIAVPSYGTLSVTDISEGQKTDWKIEGSPSDINYALERVKYRPSSNRLLSESMVYLKIDGNEQEYPISVFTAEEPITSAQIPNQKAYIDNSFSLGISHYFNYSDQSQLTYSFTIEKSPKGYSDWLKLNSGFISGFPEDSSNKGDYTLQVNAKDEFDQSESQRFHLVVDYTDFQKMIAWATLIARFAGLAIIIIGIFICRAMIWNLITKSQKQIAPIEFNLDTYDTRKILILRPDEEEMALTIYKKLPNKESFEQELLISDFESIISILKSKHSNKNGSNRSNRTHAYELPSISSSFLRQKLMNEEAPMIEINRSKYNIRYIFFYIKDLLLKKSLSKTQLKELKSLVKEFKKTMLDRYTAKLERRFKPSAISNWSKCRDSWAVDMPDLTKSLNCNYEEITEFLLRSNTEINLQTFMNCIVLEQWKDRAIRVKSKGHIKQLELYYNQYWCLIPWKRHIANWVFQKWLSVDISDSQITVDFESTKDLVSELLYLQMFDRNGYLIYQIAILPKSKVLHESSNSMMEESKVISDKIIEIKL